VADGRGRDYNSVARHPRSGTECPMRAGIALIKLLIAIVVAAMVAAMSVAALFGYLTR